MEDLKKKTVAETLKSRLQAPWVWLILVLTLGLTALFYVSQKPQMVLYNQYIKNISEYQLLETKLMRTMERVRMGRMTDSAAIQSQIMVLREISVSFSHDMDGLKDVKIKTPPQSSVARFEREVARKLSGVSWYFINRNAWFVARDSLLAQMQGLPSNTLFALYSLLDSASAGASVVRPVQFELPDSLARGVDGLLAFNADLNVAWNRLNSDVTMACSEELVQFFQMENLDEISLKSRIPMVFYFLSIVLLLTTFFFIFRAKQ